MREAILKKETNNESGLRGPDTITRIKLFDEQGILIHELRENYYVMAKKTARLWVAEGRVFNKSG